MAFFTGPNRQKSVGAKSMLTGGWGNTVQLSLSDTILKTDYTNTIWQNLIKLYYPRQES
jgi:hypothetical protein